MEINKTPVDICKDSTYSSVFDATLDGKSVIKLCDFYLYRVANSKDSPLSYRIDTSFSDALKDELFMRLMEALRLSNDDLLFNPILRNKIKEIRQMKLSDSTLEIDRIKGFFHQNKSQHKVDSLFKHIRDSFAHGRVSFSGQYLILEDKVNELTARLVITMDGLSTWMSVTEQFCFERRGN